MAYGFLIGATPGRSPNLRQVDPRLVEIVSAGASQLPPGYSVSINEGYNPSGHVQYSQHHIPGKGALDVQITGPDGKVISNEGNDPTGMYQRLAQASYGYMVQNHPELQGKFAWGGSFGTTSKSGVRDLMHFDIGGERGNLFPTLSRLGPLGSPTGIQTPPLNVGQTAQGVQMPLGMGRGQIGSGPAVGALQQALIDRGYNIGSEAAKRQYGPQTAAAVSSFERVNRAADPSFQVEKVGVAGRQVLGKLGLLPGGPPAGGVEPINYVSDPRLGPLAGAGAMAPAAPGGQPLPGGAPAVRAAPTPGATVAPTPGAATGAAALLAPHPKGQPGGSLPSGAPAPTVAPAPPLPRPRPVTSVARPPPPSGGPPPAAPGAAALRVDPTKGATIGGLVNLDAMSLPHDLIGQPQPATFSGPVPRSLGGPPAAAATPATITRQAFGDRFAPSAQPERAFTSPGIGTDIVKGILSAPGAAFDTAESAYKWAFPPPAAAAVPAPAAAAGRPAITSGPAVAPGGGLGAIGGAQNEFAPGAGLSAGAYPGAPPQQQSMNARAAGQVAGLGDIGQPSSLSNYLTTPALPQPQPGDVSGSRAGAAATIPRRGSAGLGGVPAPDPYAEWLNANPQDWATPDPFMTPTLPGGAPNPRYLPSEFKKGQALGPNDLGYPFPTSDPRDTAYPQPGDPVGGTPISLNAKWPGAANMVASNSPFVPLDITGEPPPAGGGLNEMGGAGMSVFPPAMAATYSHMPSQQGLTALPDRYVYQPGAGLSAGVGYVGIDQGNVNGARLPAGGSPSYDRPVVSADPGTRMAMLGGGGLGRNAPEPAPFPGQDYVDPYLIYRPGEIPSDPNVFKTPEVHPPRMPMVPGSEQGGGFSIDPNQERPNQRFYDAPWMSPGPWGPEQGQPIDYQPPSGSMNAKWPGANQVAMLGPLPNPAADEFGGANRLPSVAQPPGYGRIPFPQGGFTPVRPPEDVPLSPQPGDIPAMPDPFVLHYNRVHGLPIGDQPGGPPSGQPEWINRAMAPAPRSDGPMVASLADVGVPGPSVRQDRPFGAAGASGLQGYVGGPPTAANAPGAGSFVATPNDLYGASVAQPSQPAPYAQVSNFIANPSFSGPAAIGSAPVGTNGQPLTPGLVVDNGAAAAPSSIPPSPPPRPIGGPNGLVHTRDAQIGRMIGAAGGGLAGPFGSILGAILGGTYGGGAAGVGTPYQGPRDANYMQTGMTPWGSPAYGPGGNYNSPFTPQGYTPPSFNTVSGGPTYAYQYNDATKQGTYVNSAGNIVHYTPDDRFSAGP